VGINEGSREMSLENHPNFDAVQFVVDIQESYYKCLRGPVKKQNCPDIKDFLLSFAFDVEMEVDKHAEEIHEQETVS